MIYKVSGETPFQVLSTTFSIGPSSSGYDLMASADGTNYSKLFTVGANVNRQVTQVAAGSYYKLSGNTDSAVTVNWFGNCVDGNGGGGGGTQYTAGDGIQINGTAISVKAGEGLAFSGDTLIVSGGSSNMFVLELSTLDDAELTNEDKANIDALFAYISGKTIDEINAVLIKPDSGNLYKLTYADENGTADFNTLWSWGGESVSVFREEDPETGDYAYSVNVDEWNVTEYVPGDGISIEDYTVSLIPPGHALSLSSSGRLQVEIGNGLEFDGDDALAVKIGEGLAFSGNTLVLSGGTSSNTKVVMLNKLSQQECQDLYDELSALYDYNADGWSSAYTEDMYAFYLDLRDANDQQAAGTQDKFEGFFPMLCDRMHPSDYGGAAFFGGVEPSREGNGNLLNIRFVIASDGSVDGPSTWTNSPSEPVEYAKWFTITSAGTQDTNSGWEGFDDDNKAGQIRMRYNDSSNGQEAPSFGCLKWMRRFMVSYNDEDKWYYVWSADVLIGNTLYTGVWEMMQDNWYWDSPVPPHCLSWTSGATVTPTYSPLP